MILYDKRRALTQILGEDGEPVKKGEEKSSLHACMEEFMHAVKADNVEGMVSAFKACFAECDAEPHEEGPHIGEE